MSDFQPNARTIVLGCHKRSRTMRDPIPRTITVNADTHAILERRCRGRDAGEHVIVNRKGFPYTRWEMARRFKTVRKNAGVRTTITIYSFRHLWISEMLMAGVDVLLVARMAGTSVAMIERVYGHFRNQSYQETQAKLDCDRAARALRPRSLRANELSHLSRGSWRLFVRSNIVKWSSDTRQRLSDSIAPSP
jgi:integrase